MNSDNSVVRAIAPYAIVSASSIFVSSSEDSSDSLDESKIVCEGYLFEENRLHITTIIHVNFLHIH